MSHYTTSRRIFLAGTAAGITSTAFRKPLFAAAASEEVRIAILGAGWRGGQLATAIGKADRCRLVAVADPDEARCGELAAKHGATAHRDLRKVLDDPNVDAVAISTCNHWHCLATIWALDAGKDVYVEKPLSHTQWEGRQVVEATRRSDRIVQVGTQQRSDPMQAEAKRFLHEAQELGEIHYVQANRLGPRAAIGRRDQPLDPPDSVDFDLWLGPAAKESIYRNQLHYDWHWDFNTGSGEMGNWGVHILDDIRNVAYQDRVSTPSRLIAAGGRVAWNDAGNTPNVHFALFETELFPTIVALSNLPQGPNAKGGWNVPAGKPVNGPRSGYVVVCEGGYYLGERMRGRAVDKEGKTIREFRGPSDRDIVTPHVQNFVDAVGSRNRATLNAPVETGHHSTGWCNLANVAFRAGTSYQGDRLESVGSLDAWPLVIQQMEQQLKPFDVSAQQLVSSPVLEHDPSTERFVGEHAEAANRFLKRDYRGSFAVPEIISRATKS